MNGYLVCLTGLFSFIAGHSLAKLGHTREWFYSYAFPMFTASAVIVGLFAIYFTA